MSFLRAIHRIEHFPFSLESGSSDDEEDEEDMGKMFPQYVYYQKTDTPKPKNAVSSQGKHQVTPYM